MPADVKAIYEREIRNVPTTMGTAEAIQFAYRMIQLAGWYVTSTGWRKLAPDVHSKVNVRFADQQPNGRYLVCDVDVFYPNAVKGDGDGNPIQYAAADTAKIIKNTNRMIESGGQKPAVTRQHPTKEQKNNGIKEPSLGEAINFRNSPRGAGWIRCDLADLNAGLVDEWRDRRATGLSAAFVGDAGKLNRRIGHVAVLSEAQALSALPATEIFSVQDQLCFSADEADFNPKRASNKDQTMAKSKEFCGRMKGAYSALSAAYAAMEAGEEGADAKMGEATSGYSAARNDYAADVADDTPGGPDAAADEELFKKLMEEEKGGQPSVGEPLPAGDGEDTLPPGDGEGGPVFAADIDAMDDEQFAAACADKPINVLLALRKQNVTLKASKAASDATAIRAAARTSFNEFCADLDDKGHQFDAAEAGSMFDATDDEEIRKRLREFLIKSPKRPQGPADMEQVFSIHDINPDGADVGETFSADDMRKTGIRPSKFAIAAGGCKSE